VSQYDEFNEDEYQARLNNKTFLRIVGLAKSHGRWLVSFIIAIAFVSAFDSYFTFLSKQIIDSGILAGNKQALVRIVITYGSLIIL
jgi:ATP-binding cassette, subfamily B, bacterial